MGDNVSKPATEADLFYLCIDGTKASDSAMFAYQLELAGKNIRPLSKRVLLQNLLTLVGLDPEGDIQAPGADAGSVFPFHAADLKTMPVKKEPLPKSSKRIAYVLLPQGEVPSDTTTFADSALGGSSSKDNQNTAQRNSDLLKQLILAPGISKAGTDAAHLDFATSSNIGADIIYLSGHGSMAGTVCGEAHAYMRYFELLPLATSPFQSIAKGDYRSPFWMVIGACFSMRPTAAEIWLRYLRNQAVPLRGLLGYQTTSPLADPSAEINRSFAERLSAGDTFLTAWQKANSDNDKWTAMAFDHAKNDTLTSLRDLKRGTDTSSQPPSSDQRVLRFYEHGRDALVKITPPRALLTVHHWTQGFGLVGDDTPTPWDWSSQILVTNIDFTEDAFKKAIEEPENAGKFVNNGSWNGVGTPTLVRISSYDLNTRLRPGRIFRIRLFPPFTADFKNGLQPDDQIEFGLVHVRQTYSKLRVAFSSVFDLLQVNGVAPEKATFGIPPPDSSLGKVQAAYVRNRIQVEWPVGRLPFEPASITVRFKTATASQHYLWFWFAIRIIRRGAVIFSDDFDNFILNVSTADHAGDHTPMKPTDPLPPEDVWGRPP